MSSWDSGPTCVLGCSRSAEDLTARRWSAGRAVRPGMRAGLRAARRTRTERAAFEKGALPQLEPGHRLATAPLITPPDGQVLHQPQPPAALSFSVRRAQHRDTVRLAAGDLNPHASVPGHDGDRDRLPGTAAPPCSRLLVTSSLARRIATSPQGCEGPSRRPTNARASRT